jgi:PAS domain S-box-containing protein
VALQPAETVQAVTHSTRSRRHAPTPRSVAALTPDARGGAAIAQSEFPKSAAPTSYAVFDALSDIVCITTPDGTLQFLNRAGRDLLGYVDDDSALVGSLFPAHTPAARLLLLDEVVPAALRQGTVTCDTALQTADGRVFPASQTVIVTRIGLTPQSLTIVVRDVSIERQSAARLGESQRLFEMITRSSPDLIFLYDPQDERIVWMNRCPHAFLGGDEHDARTLTRREMHQLVHPDDHALFRAAGSRMAAAYSDTDLLAAEFRVRSDSGAWRWVNTRACVFSRRETGAPLLLLGVASEISARKKVEQKLESAREAAECGSREKHEFLCRIAQEFRGALHEVIGTASFVRADPERRLTQREIEPLNETIVRSTQLLETVADLHDCLRIEMGELPVTQSVFDAVELICETANAFADQPTRARVTIALELPARATPILTDRQRLRQALSQLVANALDMSNDGGVTITLHVDGEDCRPVAIEVRSAGAEVPKAEMPPAFAPFLIADNPTSSTVRSRGLTGLGLSVARAMCETIGCALSVASPLAANGSTFRITLPVPSRAAALAAQFLAPAAESSGNADAGRNVISSV